MAPMRRKSQGSIRSPHVKRNIQSQVTFEGWLFKLEGGALKQWKQRWCVLVDFCLFFYKAPHEEKVTLSILLPSYKINPCSTDDKISKKFAFKAEHQNMKTYYFAAEDKESMKKWMNAMSLATIMQNCGNPGSIACSAYDDDDSGFTSYRSRRHPSNRSSSVHNSSSASEPLKQRSNSCGDRVGEMYLGSDDKYPNLYKSTPSQLCKIPPTHKEAATQQDVPRKQPLYANAPPKPRRLTQTDSFPVYSSDCKESDLILLESSQYKIDYPVENRYANEENCMQYLPMDTIGSNTSYMHSTSPYLDQPPTCESFSNPPRPRSADFLERDIECTTPPYTSQYCENRQPQRPKSSLECYNQIANCEDYDFDDYREAIRMQADNLYANKNLMKNRSFLENQKQIENITKSDPRLNAHYGSHSSYLSNDPVPSSLPQTHAKEVCSDQHVISNCASLQHQAHIESQHNSKPAHNESMQRLLEWKQRMLQSPLSRRNQLHSTSSDASSANSFKQMDYYQQSVRHCESYKQNHISEVERNMPYQNQNLPSVRHENHVPSHTSHQYESSAYYNASDDQNIDRLDTQPVGPQIAEKTNTNNLMGDVMDNFYHKNIVYCVDSENNEILLSYDTSPTSPSAPTPFHSSHYPPQMHSFSTLPNVNDVGIEATPLSDQGTKNSHPVRRHEVNQSRQETSSFGIEKRITYSSDDEDEVIGECDLKEASHSPKEITTESLSEDRFVDERFQSASPDYVNIGSVHRDVNPVSTQGMYSSDSVFRSSVEVNQAVLKPLEQVSKNKQSPDSLAMPLPDVTENLTKCYDASEFQNFGDSLEKNRDINFKIKENIRRGQSDFLDEIECDIKREDYYRASQMFYSSIRMKNKLGMSSNKSSGDNHSCSPEYQEMLEAKLFKKIDGIDNDIGLPLPEKKVSPKSKLSGKVSEIENVNKDSVNYKIENIPEKPESEIDISQKDEVIEIKGFVSEREIMKNEIKKNLSYEEMRGQLLRKREAPPPNIVQERIKKFETVEKNKKVLSFSHSKLLENNHHSNKFANRSFSKRNRQKNSRSRAQKRILHSDSEAVPREDSDASSDDLTMKSAPILLSPLSSVLADLRKTADSGKEKVQTTSRHSGAIDPIENSHGKNIPMYDSHSKVSNDFIQAVEDAVYLPMYGIKAIKEPEYVTMSGSKLSPSSLKLKSNKYSEEHVYNEPFSPPPSFLHDVYGKQKAKLFQYQMDSSSDDDSLTENIYEKPNQRFPIDSSRNEYTNNTAQETHFVLMNSLSCSNVTSFGQSDATESIFSGSCIHKNKPHHYEQAHISVSVPDLLQLQEIKDSDASDADDEASRDFDAAGSAPYPLTECDNFYISVSSSSTQPTVVSKDSIRKSLVSEDTDHPYKVNSNTLIQKENTLIKTMPSYEKVSCTNANVDTLPLMQSKRDSDEYEKVTHVRKLRVYTKGKKPETPRIFSVPFNIDETELNETTERNEMKTFKWDSKYQTTKEDDFSLSENVAYVSRDDFNSNYDSTSPDVALPTASYAPDIISSIKEEERVSDNSFSKASNSAPYYYSDLYSGYGINFSGQLSPFKQHDLPYIDKTSPPKSSTSLLNNIRPKSPCAKNDVGRKVNNINVETKGKPIFCDKSALKYINDEETKSNIRHSLDVFQVSESKYLDAEKNKYEAGSTLEKTRPSNSMSYFKHRASTPDLNLCQYQSNEPVYENLLFQSKRVSQSLEEISSTSELPSTDESKELKLLVGPVYENIEFFKVDDSSMAQNLEALQSSDSSRNFGTASVFTDSVVVDKKPYFCTKQHLPSPEDKSMTQIENDQEVNFLDQDVLRRVSKQHFYAKDSRTKLCLSKTTDSQTDCLTTMGKPLLGFENLKEGCSYQLKETPVNRQVPKYKVNDSDSTSDVTSSCDEASAESDNRHRLISGRVSSDGLYNSAQSGPEITSKEAMHLKKLVQQSNGLMCRGKRLSVSAGDLLGKTHEELVLLLIQLRRNQSKILKAKEKLESKIKKERILGNQHTSQHYEELCNQIVHLEKQYEVTQPLVTLVDNMVKLGSLYGSSNRRSLSLPVLDCAQEVPSSPSSNISLQQTSILSKLLSEENDLQKHISEISKLEKCLQNETNSLSTLHQDKEMLEHTLFGMRNKILDHQDRPVELQKLRKQQRMIEKELIRVKRLLSTSAKKIEDATSKNDQMEQEILHLRQILQQALKTGSAEMKTSQHSRADLEAELTRLQSVLDELANHRHEINNTVEKLKAEASTSRSKRAEVRASPTGVAGSAPLPLRKKHHCMYLETDLDTMVTRDLAVSYEKDMDDIPVYANAEEITLSNEELTSPMSSDGKVSTFQMDVADPEPCSLQDINEADERMKRFYGILPKEKPSEIKTVRIVKRQSERRSRERDKRKVSYDEQSSIWIMEEPDLSSDDYLEMEESSNKKMQAPQTIRPSSINLSTTSGSHPANSQSAHARLFGSSTTSRQGSLSQAHTMRKSKRRHYTVSGYQYMLDPQFSQYFTERPRSRDDVDMERCLRTANTPDIVRSTIKKNDIFDAKLIDRELGLPQKIEIPERYVEIEPEQLSASEKLRRSLKAENICKMLSQTATSYEDFVEKRNNSPEALHKKLSEEKRKRAHLLSLNQALAREVVERSKAVAVFATLEHMMKKPLTPVEEDLSPIAPLPITQQRYNFLT